MGGSGSAHPCRFSGSLRRLARPNDERPNRSAQIERRGGSDERADLRVEKTGHGEPVFLLLLVASHRFGKTHPSAKVDILTDLLKQIKTRRQIWPHSHADCRWSLRPSRGSALADKALSLLLDQVCQQLHPPAPTRAPQLRPPQWRLIQETRVGTVQVGSAARSCAFWLRTI